MSKTGEVIEKLISRTESWVEMDLGKEIHAPEVVIEH